MFVNDSYIRKIDDLGRIVIPKELRNKLNIRENENIKIETNSAGILISKFSYLNNYMDFINDLCKILFEVCGVLSCVYDHEKLIFSNLNGNSEELIEYPIIINSVTVGTFCIANYSDKKIGKLFARIISVYLLSLKE